MGTPNLFDGRLALVYWTPRSVPETTIAQMADNIRAAQPNVNAVYVKTNNGIGWQGAYDSTNPNLTITQGANTYAFGYNGLGDRFKQVVKGVPTLTLRRAAKRQLWTGLAKCRGFTK